MNRDQNRNRNRHLFNHIGIDLDIVYPIGGGLIREFEFILDRQNNNTDERNLNKTKSIETIENNHNYNIMTNIVNSLNQKSLKNLKNFIENNSLISEQNQSKNLDFEISTFLNDKGIRMLQLELSNPKIVYEIDYYDFYRFLKNYLN